MPRRYVKLKRERPPTVAILLLAGPQRRRLVKNSMENSFLTFTVGISSSMRRARLLTNNKKILYFLCLHHSHTADIGRPPTDAPWAALPHCVYIVRMMVCVLCVWRVDSRGVGGEWTHVRIFSHRIFVLCLAWQWGFVRMLCSANSEQKILVLRIFGAADWVSWIFLYRCRGFGVECLALAAAEFCF